MTRLVLSAALGAIIGLPREFLGELLKIDELSPRDFFLKDGAFFSSSKRLVPEFWAEFEVASAILEQCENGVSEQYVTNIIRIAEYRGADQFSGLPINLHHSGPDQLSSLIKLHCINSEDRHFHAPRAGKENKGAYHYG